MKVPKLVIVFVVILIIFAIGEAFAASDGSVSMWKEAPVWQCEQTDYIATCGSTYSQGCRTKRVKKPESMLIDFLEKRVLRETSFGRTYLPIAARYKNRRNALSLLILAGDRTVTIQYIKGTAVLSVPAPTGGSMLLEFFTCEPKLPE